MARSDNRVNGPSFDGALIEQYVTHLQARRLSAATQRIYRAAAERFLAWLEAEGEAPIAAEAVTARLIERWLASLGGSDNTARTYYVGLRAMFTWVAKDEGFDSPFKELRQPSVKDERAVEILERKDLEAILARIDRKSFEGRRDRAMLLLLWDSGMRRGELASLRLQDVDLKSLTAQVDGKTGKRTARFGAEAADAINLYLRSRAQHHQAKKTDALLLGQKGGLKSDMVWVVVNRRAAAAGVKAHPHMFRHTFADNWLANNGPEVLLCSQLGWDGPAMVHRYAKKQRAQRTQEAYDSIMSNRR
jgi:site-specific recombinase XerD